jgi:diguanylate cyclase (GGDEF)-like protein/PAS domain S-box-containing protein
MHSLLKRQLKRHLSGADALPLECKDFLDAVDEAYRQFDGDRAMLERSLDLSSEELLQANSDMRAVFERIINSSHDGILAFDMEGRYTAWNPGMERITGLSKAVMLGENAHETFPLTTREEADELFRSALAGEVTLAIAQERPFHISETDRSGFIEGHFSALHNEQGNIIGVLAIIRDITERVRAERERNRLAMFPEENPNPILELDEKGEIKYLNPAARQTFPELLVQGTAHPILEGVLSAAASLHKNDQKLTTRVTSFNKRTYEEQISVSAESNQIRVYISDISGRRRAEELLIYQAYHDTLTQLPNRMLLMDNLQHTLARIGWQNRIVAVLYVDLDHFKRINDTMGHSIGDMFIKVVAESLTGLVRDGDTVARFGGDDFAILLSDVAKVQDVSSIAQKILKSFSQPLTVKDHEFFLTASIGISIAPNDSKDPETLIRNADTAMYRAKEQGRNTYQVFTPEMNAEVTKRLNMETAMRYALKREEFVLHYQPLINIASGEIAGVEALVRWNHPEWGLVPPVQFIPLAEETGLIIPLGEWVLHAACKQCKRWQEAGFKAFKVAVNLSARQFQPQNLLEKIVQTLFDTNLDPHCLELELTESILQTSGTTIDTLHTLSGLGVTISIDDFGTGYSSLSYLKRFPINKLKIDRSFVRDIVSDADDRVIVEAIVNLAQSLRFGVIAEGVETTEQLEFLRALKCDEFQGYLFSKPLPSEQVTDLLTNHMRMAC